MQMRCYHTGCFVNSFSTQQCTVNTAVSGQLPAFFPLWITVWYSRERMCCDFYSHLTHRLRQYTYTVWKESESVSPSVVSNSATPWADCSSPGSSVREFRQARILAWVAIPFSRGSSQPRDQTWVSCVAVGFFTVWATREAPSWWHFRSEDNTSVKSDTLVSGESGDQVARPHKLLGPLCFEDFGWYGSGSVC